MPKKHQRVKVVKIPLRRSTIDRPQVFPRMPRLYLELIENKAKIKQDLINKEHVPSGTAQPGPQPAFRDTDGSIDIPRPDIPRSDIPRSDIPRSDIPRSDIPRSDIPRSDIPRPDISRPKDRGESRGFENRLDKLLSDNSDSDSDSDTSLPSQRGVSPSSSISDLSIQEECSDEPKEKDGYSSDDSDDLSVRLKELLNEDSDSDSDVDKLERTLDSSKRVSRSDKYSRHRDAHGHSVSRPGARGAIPTLAELEQRGGYVPKRELRDINQTTMNEQQEEDVKRELLFKFDLLRKSYPASIIPDYNIHTDYHTMQKSYDDTVRRLSLDYSVENYKTYLVYGFMGCEFVFGNFLGFDMQGFTQQQILSMNSYEKLLIELGEKSYVPTGSKWPIELRLLFMIIMNAAFFVVSKMIMKKTGANLMGMINNMHTTSQTSAPSAVPPRPKRKMRGPNIDLGDIPDIDSPSTHN